MVTSLAVSAGGACNARRARCPQPWGQRVGGVSGRPARATGGLKPSTYPRSQRWKAPWSTGCRQPSRVVGGAWASAGPSRLYGARSHAGVRTGDNRCPLEERGGERRRSAPSALTRQGSPRSDSLMRKQRGHVLRSVQRPVHVTPPEVARRFGIAVGQTCASRRNRHRGRIVRTHARLAARHRTRKSGPRDASEKEGGHGHRPCEETGAPVWLPVRRSAVAEVGRQHLGLE